jgi:hypothetical protein
MLVCQVRLGNAFNLQRAQLAPEIIQADHMARIPNARRLDEVRGKHAFRHFIF